MAGTNYHMEALRKQRVLERKSEAMKKLQETMGQTYGDGGGYTQESKPSALMYSEAGHYAQNRSSNVDTSCEKNEVVFEEVVHDPNFRYRMLKASGNSPTHVDPIYKIMYPGDVTRKLTYYKIGPVRDQRQYDHSRDGPIVDRSKRSLRQEFNFLGNSLSMLKTDIVPEHKSIPMCRRY